MKEIEYHEIANIFPLMEGKEFEELVEDIKTKGLIEPILLYENKILDGRNRYLACKKAHIEPTYRVFNYTINPIEYVVSTNMKRRHLTPAQKSEAALKILYLNNITIKNSEIVATKEELESVKKKLGVKQLDKKNIVQTKYIKDVTDPKNLNKTIEIPLSKSRKKSIVVTPERVEKTKREWNKALNKQSSIQRVYNIATDTEKEAQLRVAYKDFYKDSQEKYTFYYALFLQIKKACINKGIWKDLLKEILPILDSEKSFEPSIKQLREAELI